jgi:hypothetical protein
VTGLTLSLEAPAEVPLDEALVVVVRLHNGGAEPVATSSRLDLAEGDLSVWVGREGTDRVRAEWPWPVDSGRREVVLAPGEELVGSALLLAPAARVFPAPGDYSVVATFAPRPDTEVASAPLVVRRVEAHDDAAHARRRALEDPEVVQSICAVSVIGSAAEGLDLLARPGGAPVARLLAAAVTTVTANLGTVVDHAVDETGAAAVAAALVAVLPPGLFPGDERLAVVADAVTAADAGTGTATALLSGVATTPG